MNQSPLRIILAFVAVLVAAMVLAAVLSPVVQGLLAPYKVLALHRIFNRLVQVAVLLLTGWLLVRHGLGERGLLGYGTPWRSFVQRTIGFLLVGVAAMCLAMLPLFHFGLRAWDPARVPQDWIGLLAVARRSVRIGLMTALIEETFFRGAMQGALQRAGAVRTAVFAVPVVYASIHFFGEAVRVPHEEVDAWSGFTVLSGYFSLFREPAMIWDSFLALYVVGVLLALIRLHWGNLAGCLGLHAGFVAVIWFVRRLSSPTGVGADGLIVGGFDGLLGLWVAALALLACVLLWKSARRGVPA